MTITKKNHNDTHDNNKQQCALAGVLAPLLPAVTIVLTTTKQPGISAAVARLFSSPFFMWFADITYDVFLTHPLVTTFYQIQDQQILDACLLEAGILLQDPPLPSIARKN
jgi:peptidoglycan/LPS O-acetylase OafA/YrhL